MPYGNENYEVKGIGGFAPTPTGEPMPETMNDRLADTMALLKELLMAMDDTSMVIFGMPCPQQVDKPPEPNCMNGTVDTIRAQAKRALGSFMEFRKRLV